MNKLKINGIKDIDGMKFHDVEGGFGEGKKAMLVKDIAEIHGRELRVINQNIDRNKARFKDGVDIVDLKGTEFAITLSDNEIYTQNSMNASKNIYLLSERGYAKLLKILEDDVAWEQYEKLVDGYFNMRGQAFNTSELSPELQMFNQMFKAIANNELEQKKLKEAVEETKEEIKGIREVVAINSTDWRKDTSSLISKIALKLGGYENINVLREESYKNLEQRISVQLSIRLTNKRRRMAEEGVCKSKRDKLNKLDVIADDKKVLETYLAIVKEMAIKYGVA